MKYRGTAGKPGGKRRRQISGEISGKNGLGDPDKIVTMPRFSSNLFKNYPYCITLPWTVVRRLAAQYSPHTAIVALAFLAVVWGYNWVVMKVALGDAGPSEFAALRIGLGALALLFVLGIRGRMRPPEPVSGVILLGLLQTTAFMGLSVGALAAGGAGKTAVLVYTMPFWTLVLAWFFLDERLSGMQKPAVVVAFAGLLMILEPWYQAGNLLSKILAVLSGIAWAGSVVVAKRLQGKHGGDLLSVTCWQMLFGAVPLIAVALVWPGPPIRWSGYFIGALLYNVIPCTALAWFIWFYVVRKLPAGVASMGSLATPVVGVLSAWFQLGERPDWQEGTGMLMIAAALLMLSVHLLRHGRR